MRTDLSSAIGFYSPSFFRIHVGTHNRIGDIRDMTQEVAATFFHEYIHYLQDLTTVYGLMNINYIVDYIKTINANQKRSPDRRLYIPYQLSPVNDGVTFYNSQLLRLYAGAVANIHARTVIKFVIFEERTMILDGNNSQTEKTIQRIILYGINNDGDQFEYFFGSHSVIESMAYELEQILYKDVLPPPTSLPYMAARLFADLIIPGFSDDPLRMIALCDFALMEFNPAIAFYRALEMLAKEGSRNIDPDELHAKLFQSVQGEYLGFKSSWELFDFMSTSSASQMSSYFTTQIFGQNKIWFDYLFTKAAIFRRNVPNLFLLLARGGPIATNEAFHRLYEELGLPVTTNSDLHAVYKIPNLSIHDIHPEMTWVFNQIFGIYLNSSKSKICRCNLVEWCRASCSQAEIDDITDERCYNEPWARAGDASPCTFARVWISWGMDSEIPTER